MIVMLCVLSSPHLMISFFFHLIIAGGIWLLLSAFYPGTFNRSISIDHCISKSYDSNVQRVCFVQAHNLSAGGFLTSGQECFLTLISISSQHLGLRVGFLSRNRFSSSMPSGFCNNCSATHIKLKRLSF